MRIFSAGIVGGVTDAERKAQNEVWFRELNERLEARALERDEDGTSFTVVCECSREECTERMRIAYDVYEEVRSAPTHFILVPGHREPQHERLLDVGDGYEVVEKTGVAGLVAAVEDPR